MSDLKFQEVSEELNACYKQIDSLNIKSNKVVSKLRKFYNASVLLEAELIKRAYLDAGYSEVCPWIIENRNFARILCDILCFSGKVDYTSFFELFTKMRSDSHDSALLYALQDTFINELPISVRNWVFHHKFN